MPQNVRVADPQAWWLDHTELAALYRWLVNHDELDGKDTDAVVYFLSKPWKWTRERAQMRGKGS